MVVVLVVMMMMMMIGSAYILRSHVEMSCRNDDYEKALSL